MKPQTTSPQETSHFPTRVLNSRRVSLKNVGILHRCLFKSFYIPKRKETCAHMSLVQVTTSNTIQTENWISNEHSIPCLEYLQLTSHSTKTFHPYHQAQTTTNSNDFHHFRPTCEAKTSVWDSNHRLVCRTSLQRWLVGFFLGGVSKTGRFLWGEEMMKMCMYIYIYIEQNKNWMNIKPINWYKLKWLKNNTQQVCLGWFNVSERTPLEVSKITLWFPQQF